MKKTILLMVISTALLLLSGCDAMLEVFYPEYKDNYDGNNILTVEYSLNNLTAQEIIDLDLNNNPLKVELYQEGNTPVSDQPVHTIEVFGEASYWYDFSVSSGSFDVWIWQDSDKNGSLESGDFILNEGSVYSHTFSFSNISGEYKYFYGDDWSYY